MKEEIFRAYDIRGVYGRDIIESDSEKIGAAFASYLGDRGKTFAVGWDVRKSSPALAEALINGIVSTGADVLSLGMVPTPLVYFAIVQRRLKGGVVVTASHNPSEWNGFKLCGDRARLYGWGMGLEEVKRIIDKSLFKKSEKGTVRNVRGEILAEYESLLEEFSSRLSRLRILIDPGNGACSIIGKRILEKLGLEVSSINDYPDGSFPSRSPEPTEESLSTLRRMVAENGYDLGVGYDGDADRALFVDDKGSVLRGDIVLSLFVKHFLKDRPGEKIVYEVSCSKVVEEVCRENGVIPIISRIGHAFILGKMIDENAVFGGEISSHLYFGEMHGIDDAIFATLKVAELLSLTGRKLSSLVAELPKYESFRKNYDVPDAIKFKLVESIKNRMVGKGYRTITIDGVRVELENGWFIFRASNTLPQVKLTAEAKTRRELDTIVSFAEQLLKEELSKHS